MLKQRFYIAALAMIAAFIATPAMAQLSSSSIAGKVTDATGDPVSGATVVVVHNPTGLRRETLSQDNGAYLASGLRPGGPYTVTITRDGYQGDQIEEVYTRLQETYSLNVEMLASSADLGRLEVTGAAIASGFDPEQQGARTIITREQIESLPTISRSLNDFARLDPRVVVVDKGRQELSIAGQNNRYNNITVDSVPTNDEFGLEASGLPARNQVISIDAIQEFQINVSPYDVAQGSFVGGGINAITKSGTNEFTGSASYLFRDESFIGEDEDGEDFPKFDEDIYNINVGGPIIKDKLFFFLNYEKSEVTNPGVNDGADIAASDLQSVIDIANSFGINPGSIQAPGELIEEDETYLVKLDWYINNKHRMDFQYLKSQGNDSVIPGRSASSTSLSTFFFDNTFDRDAYVSHLYSDWTPFFATEATVSYSEFNRDPSFQQRLPFVTVETDSGDVLFGTEPFRTANSLATEVFTASLQAEYLTGDHTVKFGLDYKDNEFFNVFVSNAFGSYTFDSIDDFAAGVPSQYILNAGSDINDPFPAADWGFSNLGLYVQDTWNIAYNFSLTYGVRLDIPSVNDDPQFNPLFAEAYGFSNQGTIDGNEVIQPRIGFNWDISDGQYASSLRGGFGLFQGSSAGVWLSNPFTNPGGNLNNFFVTDGSVAFSPDPDNQPQPGGFAAQNVDVVDPDFEQPTIWRMNLAYERELPWGVDMTLEVLHSETENDIQYEHLNLGSPTDVLPDGRFSYWCDTANASGGRCNDDSRFGDVLLLTNSGAGSATQWTTSFNKTFGDNWSSTFAYTAGRSDSVNSGTSSRAISNWSNRATFNPNEDIAGTSNYEIQNRYIASLSYRNNLFGDMNTTIGAFFESRSGRPFSYTFDNDANGDFIRDNDLLYVPAGPGDVIFTDPADEAAFLDFVDSTPCLRRFKGTTVSRNHCRSPNAKSLDLRIAQEIPIHNDIRGELFLNILNVGNLINDDWGRINQVPFEFVAEAVNFEGVSEDGRFIFDPTRTEFTRLQDNNAQSRWSLQFGVKIKF